MSRTLEAIEADIQAIKNANPDWVTNAGVMALITELLREKNSRSAAAGKSPSNVILSSN